MLYIEFIERDRTMPVEIFRALGAQSAWKDPADDLLGQIGRTMRLGPHPVYMAFCRFNDFRRLDEWEAHFRSDNHARDYRMHAKHRAIHHFRAGCYDEIIPARRLTGGAYYVEFFAVAPGTGRTLSESHFAARQKRHPEARLAMVMERIGLLAPDPGGIAIWEIANHRAVEVLARDGDTAPEIRPVTAGVYRDFAEETL